MTSSEPPIASNRKWPFLRSTKIALISIVIWIFFSLFSDNHYIQHFIPIFIETLPRTDSFSLVSSINSDQKNSNLDSRSMHFKPSLKFHEGVIIDKQVTNCDLPYLCPPNSFPLSLNTGQDNQKYPELCIDGKIVMSKGTNNCGRGINVAIIDNVTRTVTRVVNYDTYGTDSSNLETMLLTLRRGEIIILLTFDEPSTKLSTVARLLLHELGSSQAQNLQFRTSWYFITFKGLTGYSPYEEIAFPGTTGWGKSLSLNTCLPFSFEGQMIKPDTTVIDNESRVKFCENYGKHWPLFCDKTILRQPELKPNKVMVAIKANCHPSINQLIKVFSFEVFQTRTDNSQYLNTILDHVERFYRYAHQLILVDDSVVLAPDFLPFMGQLLPLLHYSDAKVNFISAWNENGFTNTSTDPSLVYRVDNAHYPIRLAFMIKRGTRLSTNQLDGSLWSLELFNIQGNQIIGDGIIPDQSRVLPTWKIGINGPVYEANSIVDQTYDGDQERSVCLEEEVLLADIYSLISQDNYILKTTSLINESDKFKSLEDWKTSAKNQTKPKKVTLICQNMESCQRYCFHFGIVHCSFQFNIPTLGRVLRFTSGLDKTIFIINGKF
ncbi:protein O-linked-mannose beta-1,2-N-acetylglucosaminyltransferase 1-like isoform X2 [Tetranychus urticae]|uniref:protein O-linked-mannose beta-1,2-N-acetylglucosaminyltransferase 1-like isoform X2 n=1 Tax=Tetranychus urticae TaxID=32264 RepID=UPI000D644372|nr:protein O-linked-mannose beta-1,2-N-acetylglucosaminyltransferase 1-like isoform X2 [Tetranychus urticae]